MVVWIKINIVKYSFDKNEDYNYEFLIDTIDFQGLCSILNVSFFVLLRIGKYMLAFRSTKTLLVILFLIFSNTLYANTQMKFACMSSWYEHCNMGICEDYANKKPFLKQVKILIDLSSKTLIRRTDNNYIMNIIILN